ncbi:hypothetical protein QR680_005912 [Steinernema hermaphroditum]|uniref:N-acetyltransferase domain-containing protein n=1 Tax=Steinernema hermaphroditum TaxID=289476 RepID=A0AA39HTP8_9BILA|nr:hypothetical protein QR680_005912 [Steinernema hermaphroditum]
MPMLDGKDDITTVSGFYVRPEYRNLGVGGKLFKMAVGEKLDLHKNVNLNAVMTMSKWYESRYGFKVYASAPNTTFQIPIENISAEMCVSLYKERLKVLDAEGLRIVDVEEVADEALIDYDRTVITVDRSVYLPVWLRRKDAFTKVCVDSGGTVRGFACLRVVSGKRLLYSPIFASNKICAEALSLATIKAVPNLQDFTKVIYGSNGENLAIDDVIFLAYDLQRWAIAEGDYEALKEGFRGNFIMHVARDKESKKVVGFVLVGTQFTFDAEEISTGCCFLVRAEYRKQKIGAKLYQLATEEKLRAGKNMSLMADLSMMETYASRGFKVSSPKPYHSFKLYTRDISNLNALCEGAIQHLLSERVEIVDVESVLDEALSAFDRTVVEVDRSAFTPVWLRRPDVFSKICVDADGKVLGYACLRQVAGRRLLYSPIFAKDKEVARALVLATLMSVPSLDTFSEVFACCTAENTSIREIISSVTDGRFQEAVGIQKMFSIRQIEWDSSQVFALTSFGCVCL